MPNLRKRVAKAMRYVVVVKPGRFFSDDTYFVMDWPDCIVQIGQSYADETEANAACAAMNIDAAIAVMFKTLPDMVNGTVSVAGANELENGDGELHKRKFTAMLRAIQEQSK